MNKLYTNRYALILINIHQLMFAGQENQQSSAPQAMLQPQSQLLASLVPTSTDAFEHPLEMQQLRAEVHHIINHTCSGMGSFLVLKTGCRMLYRPFIARS